MRVRKRLAAMHRVQLAAVALFEGQGFAAVTVEEIAAAAEVSPISVYRWFGTKEGIVLWDEYDPPLFEAIASELEAGSSPIEATRKGLERELDRMYDVEREVVLRRARLILREPALRAAADANSFAMIEGLARLFGREAPAFEHKAMAGAIVGVLTQAIAEWTRRSGEVSLGELVKRGFAAMAGES